MSNQPAALLGASFKIPALILDGPAHYADPKTNADLPMEALSQLLAPGSGPLAKKNAIKSLVTKF